MANPLIGRGWHYPPKIDKRGVVALATDNDEIEQAIHIILATAPGQRVMRPEFGCRIHELVFGPNNTATAAQASRYVREALGRWEPRIAVEDVAVKPDESEPNRLLIHISYQVVATYSNRSLVYPFYVIPEESKPLTQTIGI